MWLSDRSSPRIALAAVLSVGLLSACTVRPLYGDAGLETGSLAGGETVKSALASIAIKPARHRVELEVRNHLIFMFGGDGSVPATPKYTLEQNVAAVNTASAIVQVTKEREPTSAIVTVSANYRLTETATGKLVASGNRSVAASYDIPQQEFAAVRAERDAQNRGARELAELLRIAIAQDLQRLPAS